MLRFASVLLATFGFLLNARSAPAAEPALSVPADLAVDLVAREPVVAQPVFLNFD